VTLPAHGQLARFLNQDPFNVSLPSGTFTFSSNIPVSAIALRRRSNERGDFLLTTLPIANLDQWAPATAFFPHLADGGGWTTQFVLVNPTDSTITGTLTYFDQSGASVNTTPYSIPARSSRRFSTPGTGATAQVGSAQATPARSNAAPVGLAVFAYKKNGVTVSEAGVPSVNPGNSFRLFVGSTAGSVMRNGIAVTNQSATTTNVKFDLYRLDGTYTGLSGSVPLPASGQRSLFLDEVPGLESMPQQFNGFVRISSANGGDLAVVGLRGHSNERGDFLVTTTLPVDENTPVAPKIEFPHFADGDGYTTQFVLYGGGTLALHSPSGGNPSLNLQ
jgi:hypothetical protein